MSKPKRNSGPEEIIAGQRTFFVTSSTYGGRALLQSDRMARLLIDVLYHYRVEGKYQLHEFVVMHNHFHFLITISQALSIERAVQFVKGAFSFRAKRELGYASEIWQKGFSEHRIRDTDEYNARRDYIRLNPVRAGMAEDYPYCSARPGYELDPYPAAKAVFTGAPGRHG